MTDSMYELSYWQVVDGEWFYKKQLISPTSNLKEGAGGGSFNVHLSKGVLLDAVTLRKVE